MSLRRKLVLLLAVYAAFALVAAFGTIYGIQFRINSAMLGFQRSMDRTHEVDELRLDAREQLDRLRDLAGGRATVDAAFRAATNAFLTRLESLARYAAPRGGAVSVPDLLELHPRFDKGFQEFVNLIESDAPDEAQAFLDTQLTRGLFRRLDAYLRELKHDLDGERNRSGSTFSSTGIEVLIMALLIGAFGAALVVIGGVLIRRWLMQPIDALRAATAEFGRGNLAYRVALPGGDELATLGGALNSMAASLDEAHARLRKAEAIAAAVAFARGVAHDFNNLLTSATGSLSLLAEEGGDPQRQERVRRAQHACRQAGALARKLLDFAANAPGRPQLLSINDTVQLILDSLDEGFFGTARLHWRPDLRPMVLMDPDQLTQIVLNLVQNAREAMPEGGDLRIEVAELHQTQPHNGRPSGRYGVLTVSDTGVGMSDEVRRRIFEPFFSTKPRTEKSGRGMGLAIVYIAVQNAGGTIEVESRPGAGTTFRVHLPAGEPTRPTATGGSQLPTG